MIAEFVGLPGCGKSAVSHAVAERLRGEHLQVSERSFELAHRMGATRRRLAKLRLAGRVGLKRPRAALSLMREIARCGQQSWLEGIAKTLDLLAICGLVTELARRPGIHILDQGFFSGLWSIGFRASSDLALARLVEIGVTCCGRSPADLVIALEVEPATAARRLRNRPGAASRLQARLDAGATNPAMQRDLQAAVRSLRRVRELLSAPEAGWRLRVASNEEAGATDLRAAEIAAGIRSAME
ncbi:MAG: AAA family ATPase [Deltaproteobacteria bacterium]|nr:MAG: AAA family ATPase [Deltaproteobacteria bacterium]